MVRRHFEETAASMAVLSASGHGHPSAVTDYPAWKPRPQPAAILGERKEAGNVLPGPSFCLRFEFGSGNYHWNLRWSAQQLNRAIH